ILPFQPYPSVSKRPRAIRSDPSSGLAARGRARAAVGTTEPAKFSHALLCATDVFSAHPEHQTAKGPPAPNSLRRDGAGARRRYRRAKQGCQANWHGTISHQPAERFSSFSSASAILRCFPQPLHVAHRGDAEEAFVL